jgi:aldehyde dehydrogenase (NAD+)
MGAMINARQRSRVESFLAGAQASGLQPMARGNIDEAAPQGGFYVAPTLFGDVPRNSALANDEVFGPVLALLPFDDEADAISLANATPYGLVAGVWTRDAKRSMRVALAMRCGQVYVNGYGAGGGVELPFGGVKRSGHGREKGFEALYEFCAAKTIVINHG